MITIAIFWVLLKALALYLLYKRVIKMWYLRWLYGQRGVTFLSTLPLPIVGDTAEFAKRAMAQPDRPHF
jgi:hypothetical protein